jgi:tRNA modification GTPase
MAPCGKDAFTPDPVEATIDFSEEEDIAPLSHAQVKERVSDIITELSAHRFLTSDTSSGQTTVATRVANVGKSRLLNRLLGEERAIVTEVPGTTRDYLSGEITLSGIPVRLVDTAGLRETEDPVEREGVRRSREILAGADLALFLLDAGRAAHDGDRRAYAEVAGRPHLLLLNKSDLPSRETGERFYGKGRKGAIPVSAKTGEGVAGLLEAMARELVPEGSALMAEAPMTRLRHANAVRKALSALERAERAAGEGLSLEFPAADVREAVQALSGHRRIAPEEVINAIFGSFCVGK